MDYLFIQIPDTIVNKNSSVYFSIKNKVRSKNKNLTVCGHKINLNI
jgi:hypothetical protein